MLQFAVLAAASIMRQAPATDLNVWFCPRIEVTDNTSLDKTPTGVYDIRDAFGGTYGSVAHEQGHVVFDDDTGGPGQPDFIEWNTKEQVSINRLSFTWQDDSPGNNWRNLSRFVIEGRLGNSGEWTVLWQENTPLSVGRYTMEKKIAASGTMQFFRAEFTRTWTTNGTAVAPRICAIEAYGHVVAP